jgi:cytoskeletal protein CcmA (bactofilin family)
VITSSSAEKNQITGHIQEGTSFEGKLTFVGTLKIGGKFKGEIASEDVLIIDESAEVEADVFVSEAIIKGKFTGQLRATKKVTMLAPAKFRGTVSSPNLKIDEGVLFDGSSSTHFKLDPRAAN